MQGEQASRIENAASQIPLGPNVIIGNKQANQGEQIGRAFEDLNARIRPDEAGGPATGYSAGERVKDAIQTTDLATGQTSGALPDLRGRLDEMLDQAFASVGGRDAGIDVTNMVDELESMMPSLDAAGQRALQGRLDDLRKSMSPADPDLEAQLQKRLSQEKRAGLNTAETEALIDANRVVRADVLNKWRGRLGKEFEGKAPVDTDVNKAAYRAERDAERNAAAATGNPDDLATYEAAIAERRRIAGEPGLSQGGELDFLQSLATKEPEQVWNSVTSKNAVGKLEALERTLPKEAYDTMRSDILYSMAQPTTQGAQASGVNTDTFDIGGFTQKWTNLDPKMKEKLLPDPELRQTMDDIIQVGEAMVKRSKAGNPSGTFNQALSGASLLGTGAAFMHAPVTTTAGLAGLNAATKAFMSDAASSLIARQYPGLDQAIAVSGATAAGPAVGSAIGEEGPR